MKRRQYPNSPWWTRQSNQEWMSVQEERRDKFAYMETTIVECGCGCHMLVWLEAGGQQLKSSPGADSASIECPHCAQTYQFNFETSHDGAKALILESWDSQLTVKGSMLEDPDELLKAEIVKANLKVLNAEAEKNAHLETIKTLREQISNLEQLVTKRTSASISVGLHTHIQNRPQEHGKVLSTNLVFYDEDIRLLKLSPEAVTKEVIHRIVERVRLELGRELIKNRTKGVIDDDEA